MTLVALRTTIGGDGKNDATWHQRRLVVGGGGRPPLKNDEATFKGGGLGFRTFPITATLIMATGYLITQQSARLR